MNGHDIFAKVWVEIRREQVNAEIPEMPEFEQFECYYKVWNSVIYYRYGCYQKRHTNSKMSAEENS